MVKGADGEWKDDDDWRPGLRSRKDGRAAPTKDTTSGLAKISYKGMFLGLKIHLPCAHCTDTEPCAVAWYYMLRHYMQYPHR